jgi:uncharacterized protein YhjY with autotransporter beta-barrel domain
MQAAVTAQAISLVTSGSLNLAGIAGGTTANGVTQVGTTNFWTAGTANFGSRSATGARNGLDFTTDGLTVGMDRRFTNVLSMGLGMGFGRDRTDVGTDGSRSRGRGVSFAGYGSYQVSPNIFVDGLLGIGTLNFKTDRYVKPINDFAHNDRDGTQIFASVSGGYEMRSDGVLLSPYGRIDYSSNRLKQSTESGAGLYALSYASQTTPSLQGVLGFRAETVNRTDFGFAAPRARIEYRHQFQGERLQGISYADQIGGQYQISSGSVTRNELVLGMGSDFQFRRGLTVGLDYQFQYAFPKDKSQGLRLLVTQDLDGKSSPFSLAAFPLSFSKPKDFQVDAGFTFEDNVTRARASADKLSDRSYSVNVAKGFKFELNDNTRAIVTPSFGAMSFDNYKGLNRASAGVSGEVQYRTSGDYNVPTFAAFAEIGGDYFDSDLRRGYSYVLGGSISAQLTDRIALVGAIRHSERYSKSSVFNSRHNSIRLNADYLWTNNDTIYVTGEYRRGQITSTGRPSLENIDVADLFVQDNAFPAGQFFTYRFNANTVISTLGYNRGFGPRHSLDLSWRRAQSSPTKSGLNGTGTSYVTDLYSLIYLIRF